MNRQRSHWRLVTMEKHSISLVRDIQNGGVDAAVIELHTDTQGLMVEIVHEEPLAVVVPADHRLVKKRQLGFSDLCGETMFWFERRLNPGFYDHCQTFLTKIILSPVSSPNRRIITFS
ncbi:LysR substrate-binding domain-containing protein [Pseudomonas quasicaspiana]|uniref:LysR substrate-binding domain-containing protein n=1 Tax=Pseudomonas quasicaspiana TaxID=2829821 RepID=UPI003872C9FC